MSDVSVSSEIFRWNSSANCLVRYQLNEEEEKRRNAELLYNKLKDQLTRKEEQYTKWVTNFVKMQSLSLGDHLFVYVPFQGGGEQTGNGTDPQESTDGAAYTQILGQTGH